MNKKQIMSILFISFLILSIMHVFRVKAVPYDSWNNYKILSFPDGFEGLQVNFNVTYGHGDNGLSFNCQEDFEDLRFLNYDDDKLLYAWNETTVNGDYCEIWLKLGSSKNVTMRYNNPNTESYWDINNTFIDVIDGVVGAWLMNEPLATDAMVDYSGNGNDGTPTDITVVDSPFFAGLKAKSFNGATGRVIVTNNATLNLVDDFAIVLYFKSLDTTQSNKYVLSKGGDYNVIYEFVNDKIEVYASGYAGVDPRTGSQLTVADANPHVLVYSYDGTNYKGFVDENKIFDVERVFALSPVVNNLIFGSSAAANYVNAVVGGLFLCSQGLTDDEATAFSQGYPDPSLEAGKVLVREWVYPILSMSFGIEYSNSINDAILIGILAFVVAMCALLLIIIKK